MFTVKVFPKDAAPHEHIFNTRQEADEFASDQVDYWQLYSITGFDEQLLAEGP